MTKICKNCRHESRFHRSNGVPHICMKRVKPIKGISDDGWCHCDNFEEIEEEN